MKKKILFTIFFAMTLIFISGNEVTLLGAPQLFSPMGGIGNPPTIPILPPIN